MASSPITKTDSYQYPSSHYGHLTDGQQEALDKFKLLCEERGYYRPAGKDGNVHASHDDETMLCVFPFSVTPLKRYKRVHLRERITDCLLRKGGIYEHGSLTQNKASSNLKKLKTGERKIVLKNTMTRLIYMNLKLPGGWYDFSLT